MDRDTLKEAAARQKLQGPAEPSVLKKELAILFLLYTAELLDIIAECGLVVFI